jgi:hypothetical protein
MSEQTLDDFEDLSAWTAIASGQAQLSLLPAKGPRGTAMQMVFDFHGGGGFVVARRNYRPSLPQSYAFSFDIRGRGPGNILEFKLVDATNQNVWRWRQEVFELPADWQTVRIRNSEMPFAWGPLGGGPPQDIAAMELVIAAGPGGQGEVWVADVRLEDTSYYLTPRVVASSALPGCEPEHVLDPSPAMVWRSAAAGPQQLLIDFQQAREFGGLSICWDRPPLAFDLQLSLDGRDWTTGFSADQGVGRESHVYLPGAQWRYVRLDLRESLREQGFGVVSIEVQPHGFSSSINDFFSAIARRGDPGLYPKYLSGRQTYWTPVGTGEDVTQALFNEEGMVEVGRGSFSVEPLLFADGRLVTWSDTTPVPTLEREYLPIPTSRWQCGDFSLRTTAFATGPCGASTLYIRYRLANHTETVRAVRLFAAIRPFQVTPTWQNWGRFGGVARITDLSYEDGSVLVDGRKRIIPLAAHCQFGALAFSQGPITEYLQAGELPPRHAVSDAFGYASGALGFDLDLPAHGAQDVWLAIPFGDGDEDARADAGVAASAPEQLRSAVSAWERALGAFDIVLPPEAAGVVDTLRTAAAHILINRDGPALHPGPRRYSRAWIRDGALMGAALARVGLPGAQRDFIRWYSAFQAPDGNLPDCADASGCEWLPEFDCWGQLIFAVMDYYRFSGDAPFLAQMWPAVRKSVNYMVSLRAQRMTAEYQTPEKRACYGLLPESMSHEGYMAHPVHSYWDDFWAVRGFRDAAAMAGIIGESAEQARIAALCADFQRTLYASIDHVIRERQLDFLPGSVEFADFDPSATSIAITVADELPRLPRDIVEQTCDKYLEGFRQRASGAVPWTNYSAYEIRIIGALVRLGRRRDAHELLAFFLADRRIPSWNQWPEISWRDPHSPSFIGDMPHSWIGAEYILAVRSLFAYEREEDQSLVIAAGVAEHWLAGGGEVAVRDLPTYHGRLSYCVRREGDNALRLTLSGDLLVPSGGLILQPPLAGPLLQVVINGRNVGDFAPDHVRCDACPAEIVLRC